MMNARLIVVDDEPAHMRALCDTLGFEGYRVNGFHSPREALGAVSAGECDLLLTDLMMPEMDGIELFRAARAVDPDIAGVIMTGHGTIDTAVSALQSSAFKGRDRPIGEPPAEELDACPLVQARAGPHGM